MAEITVPPAMVEAAARAQHEQDQATALSNGDQLDDWDDLTGGQLLAYRSSVAAVLAAALSRCAA